MIGIELLLALPVALPVPPPLALAQAPTEGGPFESVRLVEAGGQPIDVDLGHAAPRFVDWDGDGLEDLLVGQFGEGRLAIYRNVGHRGEPKFDRPEWFRAGGELGRIPSG